MSRELPMRRDAEGDQHSIPDNEWDLHTVDSMCGCNPDWSGDVGTLEPWWVHSRFYPFGRPAGPQHDDSTHPPESQ